MYPNLVSQKAIHKLTDADMAQIIGISRNAYRQKMKTGRFKPDECLAFCSFFEKTFEFLFADNDSKAS